MSVLFDQALRDAAQLDEEFAKTKKLRGALHGVPVSFKDQCESVLEKSQPNPSDPISARTVEIAGYDAGIGFSQWSNKPCTSDAQVRL